MDKHARIRVLIVDDHAVVRSGLAVFLEVFDDLELAGEAANGKEAIRMCDAVRPDVVLIDLMMPEMDGATACSQIRQSHPHIQIIALTSFHEHGLVHAALQAGAIGYLLKNVTSDELAGAIRSAYAGRPTLAPEVTETLMYDITHPPAPAQELTPREREVLTLMAKGYSNNDIANQLIVSRSTIKFYVSSILAKLHVTSRVEAVALAIERHLVSRPEQPLAS
ncbi:MAG TPA: response regulator transcription factor [Roseiflexaceae bacterium]|nr:response regulator transcription factor [Roseiflexaceae bacterium]